MCYLQTWIDKSLAYIEIGKSYNFVMNVTQGSDVTLSWIMEDSVNITETHLGDLTLASKSHTYYTAQLKFSTNFNMMRHFE